MRHFQKQILKSARSETIPELPKMLRWKAHFFGKQMITQYLWNYYERESEDRIPFYLPYIYQKECFDFLRRYGKIPQKQIDMVLIDDEDYRTDYFLKNYLEELNYVTIVTDRKEYFEGLQERAFQELGLLIDVVHPWEEKQLQGNLVWDFSYKLQRADCYPEGSICFLPHKKEWKVKELCAHQPRMTAVTLSAIKIKEELIIPSFAESLLVPSKISFRESYCQELRNWCIQQGWQLKMKVQKSEKP